MNILLWAVQIVVALFSMAGSAYRISNYAMASQQVASVGALPYAAWVAVGAFEIACSLGLILPGIFKMKRGWTPVAAWALAVEMLLVTGLHFWYFGFQMTAQNPALWTLGLAALSAFVGYGRQAWKRA
ncbi:MAG TPA: DoxX family protein [bacterium]|jgi:hypothetical protein|nr:DoxX family protein [bacterium]